MNSKISTTFIVTCCLSTVALAQVHGEYRSKASGNWDNSPSSRWEVYDALSGSWGAASTAPGSGDIATIMTGHSITVVNAQLIGTLVIRGSESSTSAGVLNLAHRLTIETALAMPNGTNPPLFGFVSRGMIDFDSDTSVNGELKANTQIVVSGKIRVSGSQGGKITGSSSNAIVTIAHTSNITPDNGDLEISAALEMDGLVEVDGTNVTVSGYGPTSGSSGRWNVKSAKLIFDTDNPVTIESAVAGIDLTGGTLDIDESVTISGGIWQRGGTIDVAVGKEFNATGYMRRIQVFPF